MTTSIPTTVIKKIIAALNWKGKDETKIRKAKYIVEKLTGNTDFPLGSCVSHACCDIGTDCNC
jgi:hypothetical protein